MRDTIKLVQHVTLWNSTKCDILMVCCGPLHLAFPSNVAYACTPFNKWHIKKKIKNKKVTLHILTHGTMWRCEFTSLMIYINDKLRDIRERSVTIRSENWPTNIRSLGFQNIREWGTLWRLILRSLGCSCHVLVTTKLKLVPKCEPRWGETSRGAGWSGPLGRWP